MNFRFLAYCPIHNSYYLVILRVLAEERRTSIAFSELNQNRYNTNIIHLVQFGQFELVKPEVKPPRYFSGACCQVISNWTSYLLVSVTSCWFHITIIRVIKLLLPWPLSTWFLGCLYETVGGFSKIIYMYIIISQIEKMSW